MKLSTAVALLLALATVRAQEPSARQVAQERRQAEAEVPKLVEVLALEPGMVIADIGAGGGAMTVVLGKWIGDGRVFATDITQSALRRTREYAKAEGLTNVTVLEGAEAATNLPAGCCDAIFMRDVYHHFTDPASMNRSIAASLKPGARLAIVDFTPPQGKEATRPEERGTDGTHGVAPAAVIKEVKEAGLEPAPGDAAANRWFLLVFVRPK